MQTRRLAIVIVLCLAALSARTDDEDAYAKIEPIGARILEIMRAFDVPGVSVAVFGNGQIEWARGYGVQSVSTREPVDSVTLFQAASISKPVAAMAALKFVQDGRLDLDKPVNSYLKSWTLPDNELTKVTPVTLRRILSHTAGLSVSGFKGYEASAPVPTVVQVLNGEAPANSEPVRVTIPPGTRYEYSGGAYTILQVMLADVAQKPFPEVMRETVLEPLGMHASAYAQPLPSRLVKYATAGHEKQGLLLPGGRHTYPELAAAGLYTTPSDLARFALEFQRARLGQSTRVLNKQMAELMVTPEAVEPLPFGPGRSRFGHGFELYELGDKTFFGHTGGNEGYRTWLLFTREGNGAAVMINASASFQDTVGPIVQTIMKTYGWW